MRAPPPVRFDCGPDRAWCLAEALLAALAALALLGVLAAHAGWTGGRAIGIVLAATLVGTAWWKLQVRRTPRDLAWDGRGWFIDEQPAHVSCTLDLGRWMVLRVDTGRHASLIVSALPAAAAERHAARVALRHSTQRTASVGHV